MTAGGARPAVLCVGRLYCDLIFTDVPRMPSLGTEVFAGGFGLHAGGGAFITAAWFASIGHGSALAAFVPAPPFRHRVLSEIVRTGVDATLCQPAPADVDPQVTVAVSVAGDRAFLTRRTGPAFPDLSSEDLVRFGVRHLHIGELASLVERPEIADIARAAGCTLSLDCSWDETMDTANVARLLKSVDVFLPNESEADHLERAGIRIEAAPLTVVKRGARGASAHLDGDVLHDPACPGSAVDTTGAGDAFNAGFLSAWLAREPVAACLRRGNALGARAISGRGGFPVAGSVSQADTVPASS